MKDVTLIIRAVFVLIDSVLGTCPVHFHGCCKFCRIKIFYLSVNLNNPNSFAFLAFVGTAASFDARMNSFETAMKRDTILTPIPKRRIAKDIASYRSQSNCTKLVSTDLVHFIDR